MSLVCSGCAGVSVGMVVGCSRHDGVWVGLSVCKGA